ncbi:hypothetical protein SNEBB_002684 [Seison nebaliae]|nr:hypothetical protein SNEBB_002684 [Seison nebaliae]
MGDFVNVPPPPMIHCAPPSLPTTVSVMPVNTLPASTISSIVTPQDPYKVRRNINIWPAAQPLPDQYFETKIEEVRTIWKNACEHSTINYRKNAYREATQTLAVAIRLINDSPISNWSEPLQLLEDLKTRIREIEVIDSDGISTSDSSSSSDSHSSIEEKRRPSNENSRKCSRHHHRHRHSHSHRHRSKDAKILNLGKSKKSKRRKRQISDEYRNDSKSRTRTTQPISSFENNGHIQYTTMGAPTSSMDRSFQSENNHNSSHYY